MKATGMFRLIAWMTLLFGAVLMTGCAETAKHPFLASDLPNRPECRTARADTPTSAITPLVDDEAHYTLHFIEFDDQGWSFPDDAQGSKEWAPLRQIDCAIAVS